MKKQVLLFISLFVICICNAQIDTIIKDNFFVSDLEYSTQEELDSLDKYSPNKDSSSSIQISVNDINQHISNNNILENLSLEEELIYRRLKILNHSN